MPAFDHERLDVYRTARRFNVAVQRITDRIPKGRNDLVDQLQRAAASITLNIAEGSGEFAPKEKARFYRIAKRSSTECAAILDLLVDCEHLRESDISGGKALLERIVAMLIRMTHSVERSGTGTGTRTRAGHGNDGHGRGHARGG